MAGASMAIIMRIDSCYITLNDETYITKGLIDLFLILVICLLKHWGNQLFHKEYMILYFTITGTYCAALDL